MSSAEKQPKVVTRSAALKVTIKEQTPSHPPHRSTEFGELSPFARSSRISRSPSNSPIPKRRDRCISEQSNNTTEELGEQELLTEGTEEILTEQQPTQRDPNPSPTYEMANVTLSESLANPKTPATPKFLSPPVFNPCQKNAITFIKSYDRTAAANGWDDRLKIAYLQSFLEGAADLWFSRYQEAPENGEKSWAQIKEDFLKEFDGGNSYRSLEKRLHNRKQLPGESTSSYYFELQTIFGEYDPSFNVENFIRYFENGLHPSHYQNYRLLVDEDMSWNKLKIIVFKLDDISSQTPNLNPTANPHNPPTSQTHQCNCPCQTLQNNFTRTAYRSQNYFSKPANQTLNQTHPQPRQYQQRSYNYQEYPVNRNPNRFDSPQNTGFRTYHNRNRGNYRQAREGEQTFNNSYRNPTQTTLPNSRHHDGRPKCHICNKIGHLASSCEQQRSVYHPNSRGRQN